MLNRLSVTSIILLLLVTIGWTMPGRVQAVDNLVAHWKFDETLTNVPAEDSVGSNDGAPGTSTSTYPQPSADVPPVAFTDTGSMQFNGQNYFTINNPVSTNFTICAWVKTTSTGGGVNHWTSAPIMDAEWGGVNYDFGFGVGNGGKLMFGNGGVPAGGGGLFDAQVNGSTTINDGSWHNVCVTRNNTSGQVKLYVDAVQDGSGITGVGSLTIRSVARIGWGYDGAALYQGKIDDVRVYNTDLSQEQLQNLADGSDTPDAPPDTTAPVISDLASSAATSTTATITWNTDEIASSKVVYGLTDSHGLETIESDTSPRVTSHSVGLSGLLPCTTYHYAVISKDAAANTTSSSDATFLTVGCQSNVTPTIVSTNTVSSTSGGTADVTSGSRTFTVTAPANFTGSASSVVIQVKALPGEDIIEDLGYPDDMPQAVGPVVFDAKAIINDTTVLDSFDHPLTISYVYTAQDIAGLNESSLWMYHYHNGAWEKLDDCVIDTSLKKITCNTPSFSIFGLFGQVAAATITPTPTPTVLLGQEIPNTGSAANSTMIWGVMMILVGVSLRFSKLYNK